MDATLEKSPSKEKLNTAIAMASFKRIYQKNRESKPKEITVKTFVQSLRKINKQ
jgi:CRISPR/Cas system CSM-associated protein Csm2 small subunit